MFTAIMWKKCCLNFVSPGLLITQVIMTTHKSAKQPSKKSWRSEIKCKQFLLLHFAAASKDLPSSQHVCQIHCFQGNEIPPKLFCVPTFPTIFENKSFLTGQSPLQKKALFDVLNISASATYNWLLIRTWNLVSESPNLLSLPQSLPSFSHQ